MLIPFVASLIEQPINRIIFIKIGDKTIRQFYIRESSGIDPDIVLDCDSPKADFVTCGELYHFMETHKLFYVFIFYQGKLFSIKESKPCYYSKDEPTNRKVITFNLIVK